MLSAASKRVALMGILGAHKMVLKRSAVAQQPFMAPQVDGWLP